MTRTAHGPVAVLGLGAMGAGLAHRLLDQGIPVRVWNRTPDRTAPLAQAGAHVAAHPAEAVAGTSAAICVVADGQALGTVLRGPDGVLANGPYPGTLLCASTVAPEEIVQIAGDLPAALDVGMLGNRDHARDGELRLFVGGTPEAFAAAGPLLRALGKDVVHLGALGSGMRMKLLLNLLMGIEVQALAEATELAEASGLDRQLVLKTVAGSGFASPVMAFKSRRLAAGRFDEPDFRLRLMAKDLMLATKQAAAAGLSLPLATAAAETHVRATEQGLGDQDCAAITRALRPKPGTDT
ncbi:MULTISPECIES: NAD(P)-dependent oxidoreductase [Streptomyces]|uniref:Tartronate semialdehyde reductase n=1 Tax=Streptomyces rubradiris TaxID=285531 RepID=A0ABQ3R431_STRRR|nr:MULTISPECIES: NAD(P)-dependent oxidoreductase [Streptomyces]MDN3258854.1 NAD(P)-dependent oxidoreductase [Streptomyces sp. CSDS2]GHH05471.1 tartronate semialdehyde reductase [Streptomyces rubradiris]GHI50622.1 tartronate semialdehyde reductase [Streptomyces rubradiris]